jgi:hypothetical protein
MTTAWAHLPNAKHIDRVLVDVAAHPERWTAAWGATRGAAWAAARDAARDAARGAAWDAARDAARGAAWDAALGAAWDAAWAEARGAVLALVAWDHAGDLLDLPPDELEAIAKLGVPAAILLLPASRALTGGST